MNHQIKKTPLTKDPTLKVSQHLSEIRSRLLICLISIGIFSIIGYFLHSQLLEYLLLPLNQTIYFTSPTGGLEFAIKLSLSFGIVLSLPVIIYHGFQFFKPLFPHRLGISLFKLSLASFILTVTGCFIAYRLVLPATLEFLNQFSNSHLQLLPLAQEYYSFILSYIFAFCLVFQLPIIMVIVNHIYPLEPKTLMKRQKVVFLISFIIAAILTPTPDIINQAILATPLIILYQLSILVIWLQNKSIV